MFNDLLPLLPFIAVLLTLICSILIPDPASFVSSNLKAFFKASLGAIVGYYLAQNLNLEKLPPPLAALLGALFALTLNHKAKAMLFKSDRLALLLLVLVPAGLLGLDNFKLEDKLQGILSTFNLENLNLQNLKVEALKQGPLVALIMVFVSKLRYQRLTLRKILNLNPGTLAQAYLLSSSCVNLMPGINNLQNLGLKESLPFLFLGGSGGFNLFFRKTRKTRRVSKAKRT